MSELDLNEVKDFKQLKLFVKNLDEGLWNYSNTIKKFKAKLEKIDHQNKKQIKKLWVLNVVLCGLLLIRFRV